MKIIPSHARKLVALAFLSVTIVGCDKLAGDPTKELEKRLKTLKGEFTRSTGEGKKNYVASATLNDVRKTDSTLSPLVADITTTISHDSRIYIQRKTLGYQSKKWVMIGTKDVTTPSTEDFVSIDEWGKDNNETMNTLNSWLLGGVNP